MAIETVNTATTQCTFGLELAHDSRRRDPGFIHHAICVGLSEGGKYQPRQRVPALRRRSTGEQNGGGSGRPQELWAF